MITLNSIVDSAIYAPGEETYGPHNEFTPLKPKSVYQLMCELTEHPDYHEERKWLLSEGVDVGLLHPSELLGELWKYIHVHSYITVNESRLRIIALIQDEECILGDIYPTNINS